MNDGTILLVEDNKKDEILTIRALNKIQPMKWHRRTLKMALEVWWFSALKGAEWLVKHSSTA